MGVLSPNDWHKFEIWTWEANNSIGSYNVTVDSVELLNFSKMVNNARINASSVFFMNAFSKLWDIKLDDFVVTEGEDYTFKAIENIDVNITYPINNSGYSITNITEFAGNIWINVTQNDTGVCTLNNSLWTLDSNDGVKYYFLNNSLLNEGNYHVAAWCNKTGTNNGTDIIYFTIDLTSPSIDAKALLYNNQTIISNGSLSSNINFTDNLEIYSINVTWENGSVLFDASNMGVNNYQLNFTELAHENNYIEAQVCDAHTNNAIKDIPIKEFNNGLKFVTKRVLFVDKEYITIYPENYAGYNKAEYKKLSDRYTFKFKKKDLPEVESFIIESTNFIDISIMQHYKGHLIIPELKRWVDFENTEANNWEIERLAYNKVKVTVYGLDSKTIEFNSIGELNCYSERYYFGNLNPQEVFVYDMIQGATNEMSLLVHYDPLTMGDINATLYYNSTPFYTTPGGGNFTVSVATPERVSQNNTNITFYWETIINGELYNLTAYNQTVYNFFLDNCSAFQTFALNTTVRNITTNEKITATIEARIDYSYQDITKNFSTNKVVSDLDFCIYPPFINLETDVLIDYTKTETTFTYSYIGSLNNITLVQDLFITDTTEQVTFTVTDSEDSPLQDVIITVLEWDVGTNTFLTSQVLNTNFEGEAIGNLRLYDTWYKFILEYQGNIVLETDVTKISTTSYNFVINLETDYYEEATTPSGIYATLTFENSTKYFTFTWSDVSNLVNKTCLEIQRQTINSITTVNYTCSTETTGSIILGIGENVSTNTYIANGYVLIDDTLHLLRTLSVSFDYKYKEYGLDGVFVAFLIIGFMAFLGFTISIATGVIMITLGVVMTIIIGFLHISYTWLMTLIIIGLIIIFRTNRS